MLTRAARPPALAALAAAVLAAAPARAQDAPGLRLDDAVATALSRNWSILGARRQVEGADGQVLAARGAYDTRVGATLGEERRQSSTFTSAGELAPDALSSRTSSYELQVSRELGGGLLLQPRLSVTRVDDPQSLAVPFSRAGVSVGVVAPLGYNRGGELSRSAVRVAQAGRDATAHELHQAAAAGVRDVVSAYWAYRAAGQRLEVHRSAERRAERLLEETRTLVAAEERPAADLIQLQANAASKRIARLNAEQQREQAQQRLGLLMGLGAAEAAALPAAGEPFPAAGAFQASPAAVGELVQAALANRPELAAAGMHEEAARLRHDAARAAARPALDLSVELGYSGLALAEGVGGTFSPLYRDIPGLNLSVQLSYQAAVASSQARGQRALSAAALEQQRLARRSLREQVASGVTLAAASLERGVLLRHDAASAVSLFTTAVENEKAKFALGTATLFDVILAEDNLTGALLSAVEAELGHATALSRLRWETGTLVQGDGTGLRFNPAAATTRP